MIRIILFICLAFFFCLPLYADGQKKDYILIADFEKMPLNQLGGVIGVYGAMSGSGQTEEYAHRGKNSFKLVFTKGVPAEAEHFVEYKRYEHHARKTKTPTSPKKIKNVEWATFITDMGSIIDTTTEPMKIESYDFSQYKYLVFWVKGKSSGEDFMVYFRDAHASDYMPQLKIRPDVVVQKKWRPVKIELDDYKDKIDLTQIIQVGICFGKEEGNKFGNVIYVDDFILKK